MSDLWAVTGKDDNRLDLRDPDGWYTASARLDGCVELTRFGNFREGEVPPGGDENEMALVQRIHLCDLDEVIARLQAIKHAAEEHFGPLWNR